MTKIRIPGDDGYSHAHYWLAPSLDPERDAHASKRCGLATPGGACGWPREPGTPWCNAHTHQWLAAAKAAGYVSSEQIRWAAEQAKLPADFADALVRRWERFFVPPKPKPAPEAPAPSGATWEPAPTAAVVGVDPAIEPVEPKPAKKTPRRMK